MKYSKIFFSIFFLGLFSCGGQESGTVILTAPFGPLVYPYIRMAESDGPVEYKLVVWQNPDQLKAMIAGSQAHFYGLPTNVAAIFHTKGAGMSLAAVSLAKALWIVSSDSTRHSLSDFKGATVVMPFRGDMPHIVFSSIAEGLGLDSGKDFDLRFAATPQDASLMLLSGAADHALLAEPDLSMLIEKSERAGNGRTFHRAVDIQKAWASVHGGKAEIPLGGVAVTEDTVADTAMMTAFMKDYQEAVTWCVKNPDACARMVTDYFPGVDARGIEASMLHAPLSFSSAQDERPALEAFFTAIMHGNPARIGGKLPGDDFYLSVDE